MAEDFVLPKNKKKLDKKYEQAIKSYGSRIKTLESTVEKVRQAIGMYIGSKEDAGVLNMYREILQNAFDQIALDMSPADKAVVIFDEPTFTFTVEDNGLGLPIGDMTRILTDLHTSMNFDKKKGEYTSGMHGVGAKIVAALSKHYVTESYQLGKASRLEFIDGEPTKEGEVEIPNPDYKQGCKTTFTPDFNIMNITYLNGDYILELTRKLVMLQKLGTTVYFIWNKLDGTTDRIELVNENGINTFLQESCIEPILKKPIYFSADTGEMKCECLLNYDAKVNPNIPYEDIDSFSNGCVTSDASTHVKGFIEGITEFFRDYMNKVYLTSATSSKRKKPIVVTTADIRTGLRAVVNAAHLEAQFSGQAKEILRNSDMKVFVKKLTKDSLKDWASQDASSLQVLCRYFKSIAEIRITTESSKEKIATKYKTGVGTLPSGFARETDPKCGKPLEMYIVEGDSAGGNGKVWRFNKFQAIYPIRGKIFNCWGYTPEYCYKQNAEIQGLVNIYGCGYGKNFDISKFRYDKVIFGADADSAGKHINVLLLLDHIVMFPGLLEAGKLYKNIPPLYRVNQSNGKPLFFQNEIEFIKYRQKAFGKKYDVRTADGKKISTSELTDILALNFEYYNEIERCTHLLHTRPDIVEAYLFNSDKSPQEIEKAIQQKYRFMKLQSDGKSNIITGSNGTSIDTIFLNDKTRNICDAASKIVKNNDQLYFTIDGKLCTLYELMALFEKTKPAHYQRMKGLGEQDGVEIRETMYDPDGTRVLSQYTVSDVQQAIGQIREYETDLMKIVNMIKNVSKYDIIE